MTKAHYDLCVIGGGINGAGIARDAAGRGLKVLLVEAQDLGGGTSSKSTKLIHGGLRYLEYFQFGMVRHALQEREALLRLAPHIIWPMDFVLPHNDAQRPAWLIRVGLFLYDHLAKRQYLKGSKMLRFDGGARSVLKKHYEVGFQYSDCWVEDARLVVLNAMAAAEKGAEILTHTECVGLHEERGVWHVALEGGRDVTAARVVNAAGPWVSKMLHESGLKADVATPAARLVKGSHIITKRLYDGDEAYILQQSDKRICFVIPYEGEYTLIGTTEEDYEGDPRDAGLSDAELKYLIKAYNGAFKKQIKRDDVIWSYSGVRPLFTEGGREGDATSASRDYKLHLHREFDAPLLSVFGGKLTTYRVLAQDAVNRLLHLDNAYAPPWTANEVLPGGDIKDANFEAFLVQQKSRYDFLVESLVVRYARGYGTRMDVFLKGAKSVKDLGQFFGDDVYQAEIDYLVQHEFVRDAEDIFWRRTKLGLHVSDKTIKKVEAYLNAIGD